MSTLITRSGLDRLRQVIAARFRCSPLRSRAHFPGSHRRASWLRRECAGETWHFMEVLQRIGGETWFRLGDQDLATHIERTRRIKSGETLSEVTTALCRVFGVIHRRIGPMTDTVMKSLADQRKLVATACNFSKHLVPTSSISITP